MKSLELKEIQEIMLRELCFFHQLCEDMGFVYYLTYGTLIGAVRHKGFIPWDDDVDVWMPRNDYDAFILYCEEHASDIFPHKIFTRKLVKGYQYGIARLSNQDYKYVVTGVQNQVDMGVFIDIYPLDNFGNSIEESKRIYKKAYFINTVFWIYASKRGTSPFATAVKYPLHLLLRLIYGDDYNEYIDQKVYKAVKRITHDSDKLIGTPVWEPCPVMKTSIKNRVLMEFSGYKFYCPEGYDDILTRVYGEYMKLPPEKERHPQHFYKIYRRTGYMMEDNPELLA